jgi:hypothetical protein
MGKKNFKRGRGGGGGCARHAGAVSAFVIDQQGMPTPPTHLIPPPVYPGVLFL